MIVSVNGLTGLAVLESFEEVIYALFLKAEIQICIVYQIRYPTNFIS